jgi:hypothetical protein
MSRILLALAMVLCAAPAFAQTNPILTFGSSATHLTWTEQEAPTERRAYVKNCIVSATVPTSCVALPFQVITPTCTGTSLLSCSLPISTLKLASLHEIRICGLYTALEGTQEFCADLPQRVRVLIGLEPKSLALVATK